MVHKYIVVLDGDLIIFWKHNRVMSIKLEVPSTCLWFVVDVIPSCSKFIHLPSGPGVHSFCSTCGLRSTVCAFVSCIQAHYTVILNGSHEEHNAKHFVFHVFYLYVIKCSKIV